MKILKFKTSEAVRESCNLNNIGRRCGVTSYNPKSTSNAAITLIALIITIIVLLILSAVSLNMILGDNGIIKKARNCKRKDK